MSIIPDLATITMSRPAAEEPVALAPVPDPVILEALGDEIIEVTTGFSLRIGDGPVVAATLVGDRWTFTFTGKANEDRVLLDVDEHEAHVVATMLARRLAELEPGRVSYELQRKAVTTWLKSLVKGDDEL